ncbi:MAG: hypothetical protein KJ955_07795 [Nanoarchaeota archaeon]|nr:hypothetical protein [Nanoarchaeota archaeon]
MESNKKGDKPEVKTEVATPERDGLYSIGGKLYMPFRKAAAYTILIAGLGAGGLLLSGQESREQSRQIAELNKLELTCEGFAERGPSVRLPDGSLQKLSCDENGIYGIPATQEGM